MSYNEVPEDRGVNEKVKTQYILRDNNSADNNSKYCKHCTRFARSYFHGKEYMWRTESE